MVYEQQYYGIKRYSSALSHHGIKGQKWGIRRFQKEDGSLTNAGQKRYYTKDGKSVKYGIRGMRGIGASYDERVARGRALKANGGSTGHAIGAYIGRGFVNSLAMAPLATIAAKRQITVGRNVVTSMYSAASFGIGVANIVRTYQDIADMKAYEGSRKARNR